MGIVLHHYSNIHIPSFAPYFQFAIIASLNRPNQDTDGGVCYKSAKPTKYNNMTT